jgi:hypothetical protein
MAVDSTLLMREVEAIASRGDGLVNYKLTCRFRVGNQWISPMRLINFSIERDYENNNGDGVSLEVMMGKGDYSYLIIPNRDEVWVDVTAIPMYENTDSQRGDVGSNTRRYRAILVDQDETASATRSPQAGSRDDMNRTQPKTVLFQLMDEGFYQTRMITVGRMYRQQTPAHALRSLLTETTQLVTGSNKQLIDGVDLAPGFNTDVREHLILPHGLPLLKAPKVFQNEEGGVYPSGLGCYLQDRIWYLFPMYHVTRYKETPRVLTILNIPPNRYHGAERTYRKTNNQVVVVATGNATAFDRGQFGQLNEGSAVRFMDANQLLNPVEHGGNKAVAKRETNMYEVEGVKMPSGFSNTRWAEQRATANPFQHYAKMAQRRGRYLTVQWQHGDSALLYPGMPVKFLTNADNELRTYHGVLLGVHEQRMPQEVGVVNNRFPSIITLKIFIERGHDTV